MFIKFTRIILFLDSHQSEAMMSTTIPTMKTTTMPTTMFATTHATQMPTFTAPTTINSKQISTTTKSTIITTKFGMISMFSTKILINLRNSPY